MQKWIECTRGTASIVQHTCEGWTLFTCHSVGAVGDRFAGMQEMAKQKVKRRGGNERHLTWHEEAAGSKPI